MVTITKDSQIMIRFTMVKGFFTKINLLLRVVKLNLVYSNIIMIHKTAWFMMLCYILMRNSKILNILLEILLEIQLYNYYYYLKIFLFKKIIIYISNPKIIIKQWNNGHKKLGTKYKIQSLQFSSL